MPSEVRLLVNVCSSGSGFADMVDVMDGISLFLPEDKKGVMFNIP